jgi:hypothetical protein
VVRSALSTGRFYPPGSIPGTQYRNTRRRISENSLTNETRPTNFNARAFPVLNLIAVYSATTEGHDLTVMRSFHAFSAVNIYHFHEIKTLL